MATLNETVTETSSPKTGDHEVYSGGKHGATYGEDPEARGKLLDTSKKKAGKEAMRLWRSHDSYFSRRYAEWMVNSLRRLSVPGVKMVQKGSVWSHYVPFGATPDNIPSMNKAAELCRKMTAIVWADPPAPDPVPYSTQEEDVTAAAMAAKILEDVQSETMLSDSTAARRAFDKANEYGSGFVHYYVDPLGGSRVPITIKASPDSDHIMFALDDPLGNPLPPPYIERYVQRDGNLTDDPKEAALRALPVLRQEVLTGRNVRMFPHNAADMWDAQGAMVGNFVAWGRLRSLNPDLDKLNDEEVEKLLAYRPNYAERIATSGQDLEAGDHDRDERLVFVLTIYFKRTSDYPNGAVVVACGDGHLIYKGEWCRKGADGRKIPMEIPITQYRQYTEGRDDPYGVGLMSLVGPGNELRLSQIGYFLDHLDAQNNRKTFIPVGSMVTEEALNSRRKFLPINPGGEPSYEDVPQHPQDSYRFYEQLGTEMDSASGLQETVQGTENPNVKSGRHAYAIIQQAQAALSDIRENTERGYTRACRIQLQLIQHSFQQPREAGWTTVDDHFKLDYWSAADLGNTRDVKLAVGTLTMLTPAAKAQLVEHHLALQLISPTEARQYVFDRVGSTVGYDEDPHRLRIKRQIAEWKSGPPPDWQPPPPPPPPPPPQPMIDPMTGQPVIDPMSGLPAMEPEQPPPPPPIDPVLEDIWKPVPADAMPEVAALRMQEIGKLMASVKYMQKPEEWKARVDIEFAMLQQVLAPPPPEGMVGADVANEAGGSPLDQAGGSQGSNPLGMGADSRAGGLMAGSPGGDAAAAQPGAM